MRIYAYPDYPHASDNLTRRTRTNTIFSMWLKEPADKTLLSLRSAEIDSRETLDGGSSQAVSDNARGIRIRPTLQLHPVNLALVLRGELFHLHSIRRRLHLHEDRTQTPSSQDQTQTPSS